MKAKKIVEQVIDMFCAQCEFSNCPEELNMSLTLASEIVKDITVSICIVDNIARITFTLANDTHDTLYISIAAIASLPLLRKCNTELLRYKAVLNKTESELAFEEFYQNRNGWQSKGEIDVT